MPSAGDTEISEIVNITKECLVGETASRQNAEFKTIPDYLVFIRRIITK